MLGIPLEMMPPRLVESSEVVAGLSAEWADKLGLAAGMPVMGGGVDAAMATLAAGVTKPGDHVAMIGTSMCWGYINDQTDAKHGLISMPYVFDASKKLYIFGGAITAGASVSWYREQFCQAEVQRAEELKCDPHQLLEEKAGDIAPGAEGVMFLPYLMGERSPHNDPASRGAFVGLRMDTPRAALTQAVLEGVAFAIRDCVEIARAQGVKIKASTLCGGGAKSPLWREILANVLGIPLTLPQTEQGPGYGGAMLAAVACGAYPSVQACAEALVHAKSTTQPDAALVEKYNARYAVWHKLYPALKVSFAEMEALQ